MEARDAKDGAGMGAGAARVRARRRPRWVGWAAAVGASVAVHAGLVVALVVAGRGWGVRVDERPGGYSRTEVLITLPAPPPVTPVERQGVEASLAEASRGPAPEAAERALPTLRGLATPTVGEAPPLRSTLGGGGVEAVGGERLERREGAAALGATFAGLGAKRAARVVYVVDASGAMVSSLRFVLEEVARSVGRLSSGQEFAVVLFRDRGSGGPGYEVFGLDGRDPGAAMVKATGESKAALRRWLAGIRPGGRSNPLDGLRRGLQFPADAVFLLSRSIRRSGGSDGAGAEGGVWGRGTREILSELDQLNPKDGRGQRRVVIKAIQFLEEDPTGTMQAIGDEHGDGPGSYSVLPVEALTKP